MDFSFTPDQESLRRLAEKIFGAAATDERSKAADAAGGLDARLWGELARAGLLGVAVPEAHGGAGLGLVELCLLLEQQGRAAAPVPLHPTLVLGALPLAAFGTDEQRRRLLPGVASGEVTLTAALVEPDGSDPAHPGTRAAADGARFRLDGVKTCVPAAARAARVLVPARLGSGVALFLVEPGAPGVALEPQVDTTGATLHQLTLAGAAVGADALLGDPAAGPAVLDWLLARATACLCAIELGVAARQLEMTAEHVMRRQQFGKPIGLFQAVAQRAADAFIDLQALRLATWQAVWRLAEGRPAAKEVAIAKFFAAEAGHRIASAAQHLHGGIGFDRAYPLHRYYLLAKQLELELGGANDQLTRLGAALAADEEAEDAAASQGRSTR